MEETLKSILQVLTEIRDQNTQLQERVDALEHDTVLSCTEAARYLGCTPQTIHARARKGLLTKKYVGGKKGFLLSDLNKIK